MIRILVIDDDPITLKVIHKMLTNNKFDPITASSVKGALKILDEDPTIDLVISDIQMPKANAFDMMRQFALSPRLKTIPVIFCSSKGDQETLLKTLKTGARDFIVKPFQEETLISKVKKVLLHGKPNVLIVENARSVRQHLQKIVEFEGFSVITTDSAEKAFMIMTEDRIDIVLADVGLPEMSGKALAAQIKKMYQNIPVLLITEIPDDMTRDRSLAYGAVGYISKPFRSNVIGEQLRNVLKTIPVD